MIELMNDKSKGIDPVPVSSDLRNDEFYFRVDGFDYVFRTILPFTLKEMTINGRRCQCADKALVLKYSKHAALVRDLRTMEVLPNG